MPTPVDAKRVDPVVARVVAVEVAQEGRADVD
jgi:hypothetical protein